MRIRIRPVLLAAALAACVVLGQPALAQHDEHGHDERGGRHYDFHGRDFHGFTPFELGLWRGGHWVHGWHDGRLAWWWIVDGYWYFYPAPIYPYPAYVPPVVVVPPPPPAPPAGQYWYYCDNPPGYYPYVPTCSVPWRPVPASQP